MPRFETDPRWQGADVYVVGGGDSLRAHGFDWELLRGKNVLGCNTAGLELGPGLVPVNVFADVQWWQDVGSWKPGKRLPRGCAPPFSTGEDYAAFGGILIGCHEQLLEERADRAPWLHTLGRHEVVGELGRGLPALNGSTGALAVNLALILGAQRVFLLGFDLCPGERGRANWHDVVRVDPDAAVYDEFAKGFAVVARELPRVFPGREVVNLDVGMNVITGVGVSKLTAFPVRSAKSHFACEGLKAAAALVKAMPRIGGPR